MRNVRNERRRLADVITWIIMKNEGEVKLKIAKIECKLGYWSDVSDKLSYCLSIHILSAVNN